MAKVPDRPSHTHKILSMIEQYHSIGKYWDVQLRVDTKVFKCLRALLAANSEFFDTMFSSHFEENDAADQPITLHDMDASAFGEILRFMYTGDICVNDSNVLTLLFMSDFLRLRSCHVKEQCLVHVKSRSQENEPMTNALDSLRFFRLKEDSVLVDILHAHICRNLYHYSNDVLLMEISFEMFNALLEFSKDYIVPLRGSANVLLKIVRAWIDHDRARRSKHRSTLMKNIDFANISSKFTESLVNMLENALDEVVISPFKDIEPLSKLEMLAVGIDTNLAVSADEFDGIISFNLKNASKIQVDDKKAYESSSCIISGLSWKIRIGRRRSNDELFEMFLQCDGTNLTSAWNCYATATFTIVSHKGVYDVVMQESRHLFTYNSKVVRWSPISCLWSWKYLIKSSHRYLNNDDSITVKVHVHADVPFYDK